MRRYSRVGGIAVLLVLVAACAPESRTAEPAGTVGCTDLESGGAFVEGTVKWYNEAKGYGFILRQGSADVFVHSSRLVGATVLHEGERVQFQVERNAKGPRACQVKVMR